MSGRIPGEECVLSEENTWDCELKVPIPRHTKPNVRPKQQESALLGESLHIHTLSFISRDSSVPKV